jgi:hypothetical protein
MAALDGAVVEREIGRPQSPANWAEVEIEGVEGIDLREPDVANAAADGVAQTADLLLFAKAVDDLQRGEILLGLTGCAVWSSPSYLAWCMRRTKRASIRAHLEHSSYTLSTR